MKWLKYRKKSSSGYGNWEYLPYYNEKKLTKEYLEGFFYDLNNEYNWSEHHRGFEHEIIDTSQVPAKVIKDEISILTKVIDKEIEIAKKKVAIAIEKKNILEKEFVEALEKELKT